MKKTVFMFFLILLVVSTYGSVHAWDTTTSLELTAETQAADRPGFWMSQKIDAQFIGMDIGQQVNPFGSTAEGHAPVGVTKSPDLVLSGLLDTTALVGSWTVLKQVAGDRAVGSAGRAVSVTVCTGAVWTGHYHLVKTVPKPVNEKLTNYETTLRPADPFDGAWA